MMPAPEAPREAPHHGEQSLGLGDAALHLDAGHGERHPAHRSEAQALFLRREDQGEATRPPWDEHG